MTPKGEFYSITHSEKLSSKDVVKLVKLKNDKLKNVSLKVTALNMPLKNPSNKVFTLSNYSKQQDNINFNQNKLGPLKLTNENLERFNSSNNKKIDSDNQSSDWASIALTDNELLEIKVGSTTSSIDDKDKKSYEIPEYSKLRPENIQSNLQDKRLNGSTLHFGLSFDHSSMVEDKNNRKELYSTLETLIINESKENEYNPKGEGRHDLSGLSALILEHTGDKSVIPGAFHGQKFGGKTDRDPINLIQEPNFIKVVKSFVEKFLLDNNGKALDMKAMEARQNNSGISLKSVNQRCQLLICEHIKGGGEFIYHLDGLDERRLKEIESGARYLTMPDTSVTDSELIFLRQNWNSSVLGSDINKDTVKFMKGGSYVESPFGNCKRVEYGKDNLNKEPEKTNNITKNKESEVTLKKPNEIIGVDFQQDEISNEISFSELRKGDIVSMKDGSNWKILETDFTNNNNSTDYIDMICTAIGSKHQTLKEAVSLNLSKFKKF